ncbi:class I SAM-dependent methyltransferase [Myroides marinus]|nr:class I SAM-dependent methyltransferase [Myroides marinus]MDM1372786.1 class I SAM-dependent methyltransferase [Myroides marinus]MDM1376289.1 class I SAM-dependent methyltransferase [Myroides marinus]MDM1382117.1 class I SAM-dependent methyltransferase [Myroides marinus]MDM1391657.1 class I SAM-dependent methyltransferase [Myroides marinus]
MKDKLYQDESLVQFYDYDNERTSDYDQYLAIADKVERVLDLGCGTGRLAVELAKQGKQVVGVEFASAMLDVARRRSSLVEWIQGDARSIRLDQKFDLIILSGHVFQVFLTKEDRLAVLETIKEHLSPKGRYIFDSRNPLAKDWLTWTKEESIRRFSHPLFGEVTAWNTIEGDAKELIYSTFYIVENIKDEYSAKSKISFPTVNEIATLVSEVGLGIANVYGDWHFNLYTESSEEIIWYGYV